MTIDRMPKVVARFRYQGLTVRLLEETDLGNADALARAAVILGVAALPILAVDLMQIEDYWEWYPKIGSDRPVEISDKTLLWDYQAAVRAMMRDALTRAGATEIVV